MKKIILILTSIIFVACSEQKEDHQEFIDTYKEVLIIREAESDTSKANKMVQDALEKRGYTLDKFKDEFFKLADEDKNFIKVIDSLRNTINSDIRSIRDSLKQLNSEAKTDSTTKTEE
jgi:hypothetical protein